MIKLINNASKTSASVSRLSSYFFPTCIFYLIGMYVTMSFALSTPWPSSTQTLRRGCLWQICFTESPPSSICQKRSFYHFDKCSSADTHLIITIILNTYLLSQSILFSKWCRFSVLHSPDTGEWTLQIRWRQLSFHHNLGCHRYHNHTNTTITMIIQFPLHHRKRHQYFLSLRIHCFVINYAYRHGNSTECPKKVTSRI